MTESPVLLLSGLNDRGILACARNFADHDVPFWIVNERGFGPNTWWLTPYRDRVADRQYSVASEREFVESLQAIARRVGECVVLPTDDRVSPWLARHAPRVPEISVPLPDEDTYTTLSSKIELVEFASDIGVSTPPRCDPDAEDPSFPIVAKPRYETDDEDKLLVPTIIRSREDLVEFRCEHDERDYFYQAFVDGRNLYYCAVSHQGEVCDAFVQVNDLQQPGGASVVKASPTVDKRVSKYSERILRETEWTGPVMIEYIVTDDEVIIIEINPRIWGPLQLCVDNGVELPLHLYEVASSRETSFPRDGGGDEYGYLRYEALIDGYWEVFRADNEFNTNSPDQDVLYVDPWLRQDTVAIGAYGCLRSAVDPVLPPITDRLPAATDVWERLSPTRS